MSDERAPMTVYGHGLWYISRDEKNAVRLDFDADLIPFGEPITGTLDVRIYGAERAVLKALLIHAITMLEQADSPMRMVTMPAADHAG